MVDGDVARGQDDKEMVDDGSNRGENNREDDGSKRGKNNREDDSSKRDKNNHEDDKANILITRQRRVARRPL